MKKTIVSTFIFAAVLLLQACGNNEQPAGGSKTATLEKAADPGETVYNRTCVACHQADGGGLSGSFPPLAKSDYLADRSKTILQVIKGSSGDIVVNGMKYNSTMPPQALSDEEVAQVLTYVYSHFGNQGKPVTADEVKAARAL
jgi:nitrite reductase (NO-forming)